MTSKDSFHEVAFNISFWTRNISSARILFWRGVAITLNLNKHALLLYHAVRRSDIYSYKKGFFRDLSETAKAILLTRWGFFFLTVQCFCNVYFIFLPYFSWAQWF